VHDVFYAQTKNTLFGVTLRKICMICTFRCGDAILLRNLWQWTYGRKKSLVWK